MRRGPIHCSFAIASLLCAAVAGYYGLALREAVAINDEIATASARTGDSAPPEAKLARAAGLAQQGRFDEAAKAYKPLASAGRGDIRQIALYDLGNLYLREALKNGPNEATRSLPLVELAKQSYRDLLRAQPNDWDARYNLERALWLSPEANSATSGENEPPGPRERTVTTLQAESLELP
ncbi:MAG: hypothetical protein ABSF50_18470 [Burkholderiaceae bacterium]|jgi:mxaK protein